jgi:uncharacterized protein YlxW (UPF0749 family)
MNAFFNPQFLPGVIAFGVILAGIIYFFSTVRKQDLEVLRSSNIDLRASIKDSQSKMETMQVEINTLKSQVETLEKKNKTIEDLVLTALKQYFFENPKVAQTLKDLINPTP